ncbi:MAG: hypothetical protein QNK40_08765 [Desulfobacterales bacterium]|nr:hypothetical protein [Desulfobacterales bacterium]
MFDYKLIEALAMVAREGGFDRAAKRSRTDPSAVENRKAEKTDWQMIINSIGNLNGKVIGDIGSGGGFFTLKFALAVGKAGKVYAIDNNQSNLDFIRSLAKKNHTA